MPGVEEILRMYLELQVVGAAKAVSETNKLTTAEKKLAKAFTETGKAAELSKQKEEQLRKAEEKLNAFKKELVKNAEKGAKASQAEAKASEVLTIKFNKEGKAVELLIKKMRTLTTARGQTTTAVSNQSVTNPGTIGMYMNRMGKEGTLPTADVAKYKTEILGAQGATQKLSFWQKITGEQWRTHYPLINKMNNAFNQLRWTMVNFMFAGAAIAALLAPLILLTKAGAEWELQLKRIQMVSEGAFSGSEGMQELSDFLTESRKGTPFKKGEASEAMLEFTKAGFSAQEATQALPHILALSTAGFAELADTTIIVATTMNAFASQGVKAQQVADVIAIAANKSALDVETFGNALSYVGPIAANLGMSLEETSAAISLLSNAGLKGSKAGTSLRQTLNSMADPSSEAVTLMRKLGISYYDAEGNSLSFAKKVEVLNVALQGLNDEAKAEALGTLFNVRGGTAVQAYLNMFAQGANSIEDMTGAMYDSVYAARLQEDAMTTTAMSAKAAWNDMGDAFTDMSLEMSNAMKPLIKDLEEFAKGITTLLSYKDEIGTFFSWTTARGLRNKIFEGADYVRESSGAERTREMIASVLPKKKTTAAEYSNLSDAPKATAEMFVNPLAAGGIVPTTMSLSGKVPTAEEISMGPRYDADTAATVEAERLKNFSEEFQKVYDEIENNSVSSVRKIVNDYKSKLQEVLDFNLAIADEERAQISSTITFLENYANEYDDLNTKLEDQTTLMDAAKVAVDGFKSDMKGLQKELKENSDSLSEINDKIAILSKARFTGQTGIDNLINKYDRFIKQQELAAYGITDVFGWLQQQLVLSESGFDKLDASVQKVNTSIEEITNSYDAWRETVKAFIEESISAGNKLGKNVSDTISKYQTLLLSTSKFGSSTEEEANYIDLLRKAYDVHYGGMEDDVQNSIQLHQDAENGVWDSSIGVIAALQKQWVAQDKYERKVADTEASIVLLQKVLENAEDEYLTYQLEVETTTKTLNKMASSLDKATMAQLRLNNAQANKEKFTMKSVDVGKSSSAPSFIDLATGGMSFKPFADGGIIDKPTLALMGEAGPEMVVPLTGSNAGRGMNTITISNINITAPSGANASDFAYEFSRELQRQLRTF